MAKSGSMKWCVLVVAVVVLFVYHRQNMETSNKTSFGESTQLEKNVPREDVPLKDDGLYTDAPVRDSYSEIPEAISLNDQDQDDFADESDRLVDEPMDAVIVNQTNSIPQSSIESDEFFEFDSNENSEPQLDDFQDKLPKPKKSSSTDELTRQNQLHAQPIVLPNGVQTKVVQHIEYGKSLARRGAICGAKNEFQSALRLVAQAIDHQKNTTEYSSRLYEAMVALDEADEFYFAQGQNNGRVDVAAIGKHHKSRLLDEQSLASMTSVQAMQAYYDFVQKQFAISSGNTIVAGEALYCLGKLYVIRGKNAVEGSPLDNAKAIVHHRAALDCDQRNFKSANELAVQLAKTGRLEQARTLLINSLKIHQVPRAWENLAFIHQQLGEANLSKLAFAEYQRMLNAPPSTNQIQWVTPQQFADGAGEPAALRTANLNPNVQQNSQTETDKPSSFRKILKRMF